MFYQVPHFFGRYRLLLLYCCLFSGIACSERAPERINIFTSDMFLNIAHRGGGKLAPEETMVAYENAVDVGADVLEMDLQQTADGVIVCMHDEKIDRTTNGKGFVRSYTYDELSQFDAAYNFSPPDFPLRGQGIKVPKFEDILDAFPHHSFIAEIKQVDPPIVDDVLEILENRDVYDRIIIASLADSVVEEIRQKNPLVMTSWGTAEMLTFVTMSDDEEENFKPTSEFLQPPHDVVDATLMEKIRRFDLKVHVWTVNEPDNMRRLMDLGVDGIITDDPATLKGLVANYN